MKEIKLFCGIIIGFIIFTSCSSDQNEIAPNDPIIGEWKAVKETQYSNNRIVSEIASDCYRQGRITFNVNGSYNNTYFEENQINGNCIEQYSVNNGQWELLPNENYKISGDITFSNSSFPELNIGYSEVIFTNNSKSLILKSEILIYDSRGNIIQQLDLTYEYEKIR
jgi:hypothetical protein